MAQTVDRVELSNRTDFVTGAVRQYLADAEALGGVAERVKRLLDGVPLDRLRREPDAEEWSVLRVIGHMIAYARTTRGHLYQMATMTDPLLQPADDAAEAERNAWEMQSPSQLLQTLAEELGATVTMLKDIPDSSWGRAGLHPIAGRRSIRQTVRRGIGHYDSHIEQIERALERAAAGG